MNASDSLPPTRYEATNGSPRLVLLTGGAVILLVAACLLAGRWFSPASAAPAPDHYFEHGPAARTGVELDWLAQDRQVRARLEGYGWINRGTGVVHIPIERAMERLAVKSVPVRPTP